MKNKMHYAVHGNTAAEVIMARADHTKEHMGLTSWRNAPDGKIVKADVSIARNYLSKGEIQEEMTKKEKIFCRPDINFSRYFFDKNSTVKRHVMI